MLGVARRPVFGSVGGSVSLLRFWAHLGLYYYLNFHCTTILPYSCRHYIYINVQTLNPKLPHP